MTFAEMKAHQDRLANDPEFHPEFNQLVDGRAVTTLDISAQEARAIASRRFFAPTAKRAFLASNLSVLGMARVIETAALLEKNREQVAVFHEPGAAMKWLGLEEVRL